MMNRTFACSLLSLSLMSVPVYAADAASAETTTLEASAVATAGPVGRSLMNASTVLSEQSFRPMPMGSAGRPKALPILYVSLAAFQAFDAYSTLRGLSNGATENNPMMRQVVTNKGQFIAVKTATAVVPMILAERMWKHNKVGAIALMVAANGVAAAVSANNASVLGQLR